MIFLNAHLKYTAESQYWSLTPYFAHVQGTPENAGQDKPEVQSFTVEILLTLEIQPDKNVNKKIF